MDEKIIAAALVALLAVAAVIYLAQTAPQPAGRPGDVISLERLQQILTQTQDYSVVLDKRAAPSNEERLAVVQCGANLAGSLAALGKSVKNFEYNAFADGQDVCVTSAGTNASVGECEKSLGGYVFRVAYGPVANTTLYEDRADVYVNSFYTQTCSITSEESARAVSALNQSQISGILNSS